MLKAMCIYPVCSKHNKGTLHLPVVIVTTEETASAHVDVLLLFLLLFLLLLLLLLLSRGSSAGSGGGSTTSGNGDKLLESLLDHLLDILALEVSQELLDLLVLSLSANGLQNGLDVLSLLDYAPQYALYSGLLVATQNKHQVSTQMSHLPQCEHSTHYSNSFVPISTSTPTLTIPTSLIKQ